MSLPSVVVVDDAPEVRTLVRRALQLSGRLVVVGEAADGAAGVELAESLQPDIVLLDVSMPVLDGLGALPRIRSAAPATRVVMYTGHDEPGLAETAKNLGAATLVEKSAAVPDLVDTLLRVASAAPTPPNGNGGRSGDQEALHRSEERFRLLVEAVRDYAIFMLTTDGMIASWNAGAERIKGYRADEIIGRHFRTFYPPEQQESRHPEHELEWALRDGRYEEEGWRVRKDGTRFWANVVITAVHDSTGEHIGFTKVTRDMTERRRFLDDLEAMNARLKRAADEQAQFLAVTAHELRTPISVLSGAAGLIAGHWEELAEDERAELFESMASSATRLRRLLDDLLTASRLQSGTIDFRRSPQPIAPLLAAAVARAQGANPGPAITLSAPEDLTADVDPDRLAQAVDNLINNALLHGTPPVQVSLVDASSRIEIRVSDAGGGVPDHLTDQLFSRFATGQKRTGTGLGLFIVRELARAHGGDATYEPPVPGRPSGAFVISLPRVRGAAGGATPVSAIIDGPAA